MHFLQEANEESKAVTKASAMKGIVTCYNAMSVILLVESTSNCLANNRDTLIKYFIFISFECEI